MGLDISVYKVKSIGKTNPKKIEDFYTLNRENGRPELKKKFKDFIFEKENSYFDLENPLKKKGFDIKKDLIWGGTSYGKKTVFTFLIKKHPLMSANKYLDKIWHETYFATIEELKDSKFYKTFAKTHLKNLLKAGWKEKYRFYADGNDTTYYNLVNAWEFCKKKVRFELVNPPTIKKKEQCITFEEVGYQRKGANKLFYEKGMWDSPAVLDKKTLTEHWKKYFSKNTPDSKGGFGSGVEYELSNADMKKRFKENIIDKFIEGETFVVYH